MELPLLLVSGHSEDCKKNDCHEYSLEEVVNSAKENASIVCAPTFGLYAEILSKEDDIALFEKKVSDALAAAKKGGGSAVIAAEIGPLGLEFADEEPVKDVMNYIEAFSCQAQAAVKGGAEALFIDDMPGMWMARAAVIGARQSGLPVYVCVNIPDSSKTADGGSILACLICMQKLGVSGFGLSCKGNMQELAAAIKGISPYAKVPLMADIDGAENIDGSIELLLGAGAGIIRCSRQLALPAAKALENKKGFYRHEELDKRAEEKILVCDTNDVYFLEEDYTPGPPLECELEMSDEIINMEAEAVDAILFHIKTFDDADFFGLNCHMTRTAVQILAESAEMLEIALARYCGCAIVDPLSDVPKEELARIAEAYGGIFF